MKESLQDTKPEIMLAGKWHQMNELHDFILLNIIAQMIPKPDKKFSTIYTLHTTPCIESIWVI